MAFKIGIFGAGRGTDMARHFASQGCELVALCEFNPARIPDGLERIGKVIPTFTDFDKFLEVEMDAVIIANFFHEHAPYAIKCFRKNIHVFSECISNGTMGEGVMLYNEFKKSKSIYMIAENYPELVTNREIKRICNSGTLGKILYAEGEYNSPLAPTDVDFLREYNYFQRHWRNYVPATYYITHSLGPVMHLTGAKPKRVTAFAIFEPFDKDDATAKQNADRSAIITILNDNNSVFRVTGRSYFAGYHNSYRVCGTNGSVETIRGTDDYISVRYNPWATPNGSKEVDFYKTEWNDPEEYKFAGMPGHAGADFMTVRTFIECLKKNKQPDYPFNLEGGLLMSSVAILGHRSVLENGKPFDIPDFNKEEDRKMYENDFSTPFPDSQGNDPTMACCSNTEYKASDKQLKNYEDALKSKN